MRQPIKTPFRDALFRPQEDVGDVVLRNNQNHHVSFFKPSASNSESNNRGKMRTDRVEQLRQEIKQLRADALKERREATTARQVSEQKESELEQAMKEARDARKKADDEERQAVAAEAALERKISELGS